MAVSEAKAKATEARLEGITVPTGAPWIALARRLALSRLTGMGLPAKRDEYWRNTDPASLTAAVAKAVPLEDAVAEAPAIDGVDRLRLVFVDGVFDAEASDDQALAGVEIDRLPVAAERDIHWVRELFGVLETRGHAPVPRPLAALNSALATEGMVLRVTAKASKPVEFIYRRKTDNSDAMLHHCIKLESGADLTLLESGPAGARSNIVLEVEVADQAAFHHVRTQGRDCAGAAATHLFARLGAESRFKSFTLSANGALTRNEVVLELTGDDAVAHVAGAALGSKGFHHDDTVFITHDAERCESRQVFKKVLRRGATGVFQGKILVKPGAQKTDGYQVSQALLLDDDCQFLAKPELEIYADDVQCSHGSTSGAIDETALFYLRSRGVPEKDAQALLVLAFLADAVEEIEDTRLAEDIRARLEGWLSHGFD